MHVEVLSDARITLTENLTCLYSQGRGVMRVARSSPEVPLLQQIQA